MQLSYTQLDALCVSAIRSERAMTNSLHAAMLLLYITGARASEVTSGGSIEYLPAINTFKIWQSKIGVYRYMVHGRADILPLSSVEGAINRAKRFSYSTLSRELLGLNLLKGIHLEGKKLGLHVFRHNYIKQLYFEQNKSVQEIKEVATINSSLTVLHYINSTIYM